MAAIHTLLMSGRPQGAIAKALSGRDGGYYLVSPEYCFQDTAGTTPCVAGDPVGHLADRSGNGRHLIQATSTARPLLQQDAGGYWYLQTDGTDDVLTSATGSLLLDPPNYIGMVVDKDAQNTSTFLSVNANSSTVYRRFVNVASSSRVAGYVRDVTNGTISINSAVNLLTVGVKGVVDTNISAGTLYVGGLTSQSSISAAGFPDGYTMSSAARISTGPQITSAAPAAKYYAILFIAGYDGADRTAILNELANLTGAA